MRDWQTIVAKNVRKLRQQRKLTQEQLAFAAAIDLTYLGGIERGRRNPSLMVMARIAEALGVALPRLLSD
jgi:transcriptional regulator with XRE-family HTH domain